MADETPRLGLGTYESGDEWDHTDTVEAVDRHAIVRGPIADRPEAGEYDDELYHATDQGITWRWDGDGGDWVYFGGRGSADRPVPGTSHFEAATMTRASTAESPVWNVEAHGIEGDGETAVGAAVHDLLETVHEAGGGIVYFPPGRYLLERTPLIGDDTILQGAGQATVLEGPRPEGEEGRALLSNRGFDATGYDGASNWAVRDLCIDAPESTGIMPAHAENVRLEGIYGDRIYYHHVDVVSSKNVTVDGYWATRGGEGGSDAPVQFDNQNAGTGANGVWDGKGETAVTDDGEFTNAVVFDDMADLKLTGITAKGAKHQAFRFREGVNATLTTARAADCGTAGVYVGPDSSVAYGGVTFENVGRRLEVDGDLREWVTS